MRNNSLYLLHAEVFHGERLHFVEATGGEGMGQVTTYPRNFLMWTLAFFEPISTPALGILYC